jgi:hypothetical protein
MTRKTPAQMDREIAEAMEASGRNRYMLVDNQTGKDMRIAHDFEVKLIQSKRGGVAMLELGGGWNVPVKHFEVRLRDLKAPKGPARKDVRLSPGTTIRSRSYRIGEVDMGRLYYIGEESFRTLEAALKRSREYAKQRRVAKRNEVIVETQQLAKSGVVYGSKHVLHSVIDGDILEGDY